MGERLRKVSVSRWVQKGRRVERSDLATGGVEKVSNIPIYGQGNIIAQRSLGVVHLQRRGWGAKKGEKKKKKTCLQTYIYI